MQKIVNNIFHFIVHIIAPQPAWRAHMRYAYVMVFSRSHAVIDNNAPERWKRISWVRPAKDADIQQRWTPTYARTFKHKHTHTHTSTGWLRSFYFSPCAFLRHFFCCTKCSTPTAKRAMERIKISQYFGSPSKLKCCYSHKLFDNKRKQHENAIWFFGDGIRRFTNFCFIVILHFSESQSRLHHHNVTLTQNGDTLLSSSRRTIFLLFLWFILLFVFSLPHFSHKKHGPKSCRNYRFYFLV